MKTLITKQNLLAVFTAVIISANAVAGIKITDTTACLQLSGKVLKIKTTSTNTYTVALMRDLMW